jgi:Family of unknown function (DUF6412)
MPVWLVAVPAQLAGYWQAPGHLLAVPSGSGLMALAALALTGVIFALLARDIRIAAVMMARPLRGRAAALRQKAWSAAFQRQRDPDAAGRARPRAPAAVPAAA